MRRLLEGAEVVLLNDWVVAVVDAALLCLGLSWTLWSLGPSLRAAIERRGARAPRLQEKPMLQQQLLMLVLGVTLAAPASPQVWAATSPSGQLKAQMQRVFTVLEDPELRKDGRAAERRAAIRQAAADMFDLTEITRRSLGRHWSQRTPAEQQEVTALFGELLERSYLSKIEGYSGERVAFTGESIEGDQAVVKTRIATKQRTEIPVDYRLLQRGDRWLVYDVTIEGVSLVANYRGQFDKIIQGGSFAELVRRLRARLDESAAALPARPAASR